MRQRMYDISCLLVSIQDILKLKCNQSKKKFLTAQKKSYSSRMCAIYLGLPRCNAFLVNYSSCIYTCGINIVTVKIT